jgi:hypothetical protein
LNILNIFVRSYFNVQHDSKVAIWQPFLSQTHTQKRNTYVLYGAICIKFLAFEIVTNVD